MEASHRGAMNYGEPDSATFRPDDVTAGAQETAYDSRRGSRPGGRFCCQNERSPHRPSLKIRRLPGRPRRLGSLAGRKSCRTLPGSVLGPVQSKQSAGHVAQSSGTWRRLSDQGAMQGDRARRWPTEHTARGECWVLRSVSSTKVELMPHAKESERRCLLCGNRVVLTWKAHVSGRCGWVRNQGDGWRIKPANHGLKYCVVCRRQKHAEVEYPTAEYSTVEYPTVDSTFHGKYFISRWRMVRWHRKQCEAMKTEKLILSRAYMPPSTSTPKANRYTS